ncbi:MAG: S1 RNA-binding domain-containing protein [Clostridium fessum]
MVEARARLYTGVETGCSVCRGSVTAGMERRFRCWAIEADEEKKRLVLSGRELAREKQDAEKKSRIARCETGAIMEGTVETIKPYGAFVLLENGLSGTGTRFQMSKKRVENPGAVVKVGQKVTA